MITLTGEYALRAAVCLALRHPTPLTTLEIAQATRVPPGYLSKVMQSMARRGLVGSRRGLHGGFRLEREPSEISVLDVLDCVDLHAGKIDRCPLSIPSHENFCELHRLVRESAAAVNEGFRRTTLAELVASTQPILPLCEDASDEGIASAI
jgi:Rrf2 family nitric oxide-sensitive transcriptional repressor